jgi:hypothetical protein
LSLGDERIVTRSPLKKPGNKDAGEKDRKNLPSFKELAYEYFTQKA